MSAKQEQLRMTNGSRLATATLLALAALAPLNAHAAQCGNGPGGFETWKSEFYGGANNDMLFGGTGNDFLYGGLGTNTFKFTTGWGQDTIEDWTAGTNSQIDLTGLASLGVHAIGDLTQTITSANDIITSTRNQRLKQRGQMITDSSCSQIFIAPDSRTSDVGY
jgi:hypothetical protein